MDKLIYITIIGVFLLICFTTNVKADLPTNIFEVGDTINVYIYCIEINNSVCSSSTSCEITLQFATDDTTISLSSHTNYGEHKDTAIVTIERIA